MLGKRYPGAPPSLLMTKEPTVHYHPGREKPIPFAVTVGSIASSIIAGAPQPQSRVSRLPHVQH
ncbi:hypothetical protein INS49_000329 [Diaporthe citri]|uniref:uncharacterized protein n=1 Tax=Diaporthe citri TaxID=83186 RepID=UPI001C7F466A|nr:uncharacterized protein INS49_000329 [Diaporthe citri]KAG6366153.1 hypothetical protein INS49_000329 [Diaporthe citri]